MRDDNDNDNDESQDTIIPHYHCVQAKHRLNGSIGISIGIGISFSRVGRLCGLVVVYRILKPRDNYPDYVIFYLSVHTLYL